MYRGHSISVIIPALDEEQAIGHTLDDIPHYIDRVVVCDNGSKDRTPQVAVDHGATVVKEVERGYGAACLRAMDELDGDTDVVVFLDADYSDYPHEMILLLDPITEDQADIVIGSRMLKADARKVLTPVARFGNWLSTRLIKLIWGYTFSDLGPFRAVRYDTLRALEMQDRNFGWTVELQIKAARRKLRAIEVPVSYRERIGRSKISGTIMGSIKAGGKILYLIFREIFRR